MLPYLRLMNRPRSRDPMTHKRLNATNVVIPVYVLGIKQAPAPQRSYTSAPPTKVRFELTKLYLPPIHQDRQCLSLLPPAEANHGAIIV